eukprot:5267116-Alexandrium_andersonii.AAC.1
MSNSRLPGRPAAAVAVAAAVAAAAAPCDGTRGGVGTCCSANASCSTALPQPRLSPPSPRRRRML